MYTCCLCPAAGTLPHPPSEGEGQTVARIRGIILGSTKRRPATLSAFHRRSGAGDQLCLPSACRFLLPFAKSYFRCSYSCSRDLKYSIPYGAHSKSKRLLLVTNFQFLLVGNTNRDTLERKGLEMGREAKIFSFCFCFHFLNVLYPVIHYLY